MTNILAHDVPTYVRELISKEFGSADKREKAHWENHKFINREHQIQQKQTEEGYRDHCQDNDECTS
jgi:hypothetical protein